MIAKNWSSSQALEEHAAELKQLTGQLSHALGEGRRLQLQNEELQQASDHYHAENARLKVLLIQTLFVQQHLAVSSSPFSYAPSLSEDFVSTDYTKQRHQTLFFSGFDQPQAVSGMLLYCSPCGEIHQSLGLQIRLEIILHQMPMHFCCTPPALAGARLKDSGAVMTDMLVHIIHILCRWYTGACGRTQASAA